MKLKWIEKSIEKEILVDNPIESNFSEELDSATILLLSQEQQLNIEVLDEVVILNDDNSVFKYFCIGDYEEKMVNPAEPHYDYTITLVSQTKELEGIVLPNLSITKTDAKRSVWYYINRYLELYAPKVRRNSKNNRLPYGYQEVEYIQSTGTQYINTGFVPNQNTGLIFDYEITSFLSGAEKGIAGTRRDYQTNGYGFGYVPRNSHFIAQYNNEFYESDGALSINTRITSFLDGNQLLNGGSEGSTLTHIHNFTKTDETVFTGYGPIYLFALNQPVVEPGALKGYECIIFYQHKFPNRVGYYDRFLTRHFIPCYRKSDNAIGMYDLIEGQFYENAGLGTFLKGPDVSETTELRWESKWTVNPLVEEKLKNIRCPEMQWNRPTLREVLTDLMMVVNCIPILNNNEISLFDLGNRLDTELTNQNILTINRSRSIEDYATEIEMELQNVIQDSEDGVYNLTNIVEHIGFRNEDEYALTTQNVRVYTKNPIYEIKHFWLCVGLQIRYAFGIIPPLTQYNYIEIDLCDVKGLNFVKEYKKYITLPIAHDSLTITTLTDMVKYQNFNLHYNRGGREINGFFDETKKFWFVNKSFMEELLAPIVGKLKNPKLIVSIQKWGTASANITPISPEVTIEPEDFSFKIEYQSLANTKFKAGKYLPYNNERVIVDNQTNSYVNASKQGILEYLKANRLGNELLLINARYDNLSDTNLVDVGSTYNEDYVIFKRQIQINPNYVDVNYYATKHYVLRDYFTGIKAKIRSWKIESEESLVRNELHKYYYEFSFENRTVDESSYLPVEENAMWSSFKTHYSDEVMKYGFIQSMIGYGLSLIGEETIDEALYDILLPEEDNRLNENYSYIITELNNKVMGNTIVFDTQMTDNWSGGLKVLGKNPIKGVDYPIESDVRYVDDFGEARKVNFTMTSEMNINKSDDYDWQFPVKEENTNLWFDKYSTVPSDVSKLVDLFKNKPLATDEIFIENAQKYEEEFEIFKDQREIIAVSLQLEYCSNNENIVFGNQLVKDNNLVSTNYRTKYQEPTYTVVGELIAINIFDTVTQLPTNSEEASIEGGMVAILSNGYYYIANLENGYGNLYDLEARDVSDLNTLGSALSGKWAVGIAYTYTYPIPEGSTYRNIAFDDIPDDFDIDEIYFPDDYPNKYIVTWIYKYLRTLSTLNVDFDEAGGSTSENDTYKVIKHLNNPSIGELVDIHVFNDTSELSRYYSPGFPNNGKYAAVIMSSLTRLYVSNGSAWMWATDSNGKYIFLSDYSSSTSVSYAGSSYTFSYEGKLYYSNGNTVKISWIESPGFTYQLLKSNGSNWVLLNTDYTNDSTNVYYYNISDRYRQWKNSAWSTAVSGDKLYKLYHSDGYTWINDGYAQTGIYAYVGDTTDSITTEWYQFSGSSWSFVGYSSRIVSNYKLYTYTSNAVLPMSDSNFLNNNFRYGNNNYRWNVTDQSTNEGTWVVNNVFQWTLGFEAQGKYFSFEGNVYLYNDGQLLYQESQIPIRNVNREDLKLFKSNEKIRIYDMDFLPDDKTQINNWSFSISGNYITIQGLDGVKTYYITDSNNNVLLAFNAPTGTTDNIVIYLNGYCSRNKKIYN